MIKKGKRKVGGGEKQLSKNRERLFTSVMSCMTRSMLDAESLTLYCLQNRRKKSEIRRESLINY